MNFLSDPEFAILHRMIQTQGAKGKRLDELAKLTGLSAAYLSRTLRRLEGEGWIERQQISVPEGRIVQYRPKAGIAIQWISPESGAALRFAAGGELNWNYPLVQQIPDLPARESIHQILEALRGKGLLDAPREAASGSPAKRRLRPGLALIVYGSTARGAAREGADVDVLVVPQAPSKPLAEAIADIAAETSLVAPRSLQVHVANDQLPFGLPPPILGAIQQEGIVVYDGTHITGNVPPRSVFDLVYGGREPA